MPGNKYWIKLYHEILTDPKMGQMRDRLWRRVIEMFLFAGKENDDGYLPDINDMAWTLRVSVEQLETEMGELSDLGILDRREGQWLVTKFAERQAPSDAAIRMRRYRKRKREAKKKEKNQKKKETNTDTEPESYRASPPLRNVTVTRYVTRYAEAERGVIQEFGAKALWADKSTPEFEERWKPYINAWLDLAEGDAEKVVDTVRDVLADDMGKYTITTPKSIRGEVAKRLTGSLPGGIDDTDAAWELVKQAAVSTNIRQTGIKALGLPSDIEAAALVVGTPALADLSQYTETKLKAQFAAALQQERHGTSA